MFERAPKDVILEKIVRKLSFGDTNCFVRTCKLFGAIAQAELTDKKVFYYAIYGQPRDAIDMITANPELLRPKKTFVDASGLRTYVNRTIGQFVLGSDDINFWKELEPLYDLLPDGQALKAQHIAEQLPEPVKELVNTYDFNPLVLAFNNTIYDETLRALELTARQTSLKMALDQFRHDFSQKSEVTTGRDSTIANFVAAIKIYADINEEWPVSTRSLFYVEVLGLLVDCLPISYLQRIMQGLVNLEKPLDRSVTQELFPRDLNYRLGLHCFIDCYRGKRYARIEANTRWFMERHMGGGQFSRAEAVIEAGIDLENLCRANTSFLAELLQANVSSASNQNLASVITDIVPPKSSGCQIC